MSRIGVHSLHLLPYSISIIRQVDTVSKTLTHLLFSVSTRQTACRSILWKHDIRLDEHWSIYLIKTANKLTCQLKHWLLILTCWYCSSLKGSNVSSLRHRISKETHWDISFKVAHLNLSLHRWVALNTTNTDKIHQEGGQFCQLWNLTLYIQRTLLWVKSS